MFVPTPCACCLSSTVLVALGVVVLIVHMFGKTLTYLMPRQKLGLKIYGWMSFILNISIVLVAIFFGVLISNEKARNFVFYKLISGMAKYPHPMDELRCENLKNLSGRILEIGPGPGTNFRCWQNNTNIQEWVGVEPNPFFQEKIEEQRIAMNISFPTRTVWLKGENVDVEPGSFDYVVGTHVLCSVDDVYTVLRQVSRALKPQGAYYFLEHVAAEQGSTLEFWQQVFSPFFLVVGNGCKFKTLWHDLTANTGLSGFEVSLERIDISAIVPIPLIAPHVKGVAIKQ